ncbi:receptor like protein 1, partial [Tanacetum coccineum]
HFEELRSLNLLMNCLDNEILNTELETLSSLKNLEILDLSSNYDIDNDILPSLTTLTSLRILDLSYTSLKGQFRTAEFKALVNLEILDLTDCGFSCSERDFILKNLETLNLKDNSFNESVISSLKILPSLRNLDLSGNQLSGSFPPHDLAYLTNLEKLDLSGNKRFTSTSSIQDCKRLSRLKRLESITLTGSNFDKSIISCVRTLPSLKTLNLRHSRSLGGPFPFHGIIISFERFEDTRHGSLQT